MNDHEDSQNEKSDSERGQKQFDDFARSVRDAVKNGGKDARDAVEKHIPKAREDFSKGVHDIAYAFSYAATFGTALLREFAPEPLTDGVREGKEAGQRAADEVVRNRKEREARESKFTPGDDDSEPVMV